MVSRAWSKDVHFTDFDDLPGRHWSQRGISRLARTMYEKGRITKARKAWVKAVADVVEDCFEVQRKVLQSCESRVRAAKDRARSKAKACAVTQRKPAPTNDPPVELDVHHLFDESNRPDLASLEDNLLLITSALHRNFHTKASNCFIGLAYFHHVQALADWLVIRTSSTGLRG